MGVGLNQRQNKAREKLIRLSKQQFNELSTDVYDELMRRQNSQSTHPPDTQIILANKQRINHSSYQKIISTPNETKHVKN
jgi:hypothetical protein